MSGVERALVALRNYPRVSAYNIKDLPYSKLPKYHGLQRKKRGLGHRGMSQFQCWQPLGTLKDRTPFYITVPKEPYNKNHLSQRPLVRLSLLDLQRLIDLSRIDPNLPIDMSTICNTGLFHLSADNERHYGFHLTEEYASELVIAAVERVGGVITTRYYDLLSVFAKADPYAFFEKGLPIPRGKKPPLDALKYYTSSANRGYLASPEGIAEARIWLAQKYGYAPVDISSSPRKDLLSIQKEPWRIFLGLEPGWLVSLADKAVIKPIDSSQRDDFYKN
ncbi:39S ribosomal protein L15 mitochondrial [Taenia crassiceps]|uniref:Large ribosomal subunit protein uL15m n=1 Tax=Taenia crassiceps TaxID=6207 RepID=A0ABR4QNY3_9CEST